MSAIIRKFLQILMILTLLSLGAVLFFRYQFNDAIRSLAETQVINTTSDLINDAIDQQIENGNIRYDRMVYFEKDLDGRITALKTNMSEVNRLKTDILNLINDQILALDTTDLGIPMGSLFLPEFLSGRGPLIPVQVLSIRNSDASFSSNFSEAGINQTLQQMNMHVSVDVTILVLGDTEIFTVSSQVIVAETIIVGQVPDTYLHTGGNYGDKTKN
ncbi:MAG: sporulation protein YunB [Oscillospiraceae bacterium]|nr:sporulation protein YunB [Oscillospiraceae bacterium]